MNGRIALASILSPHASCARRRAIVRARQAGMTLIEIMVVMVLLAVILGTIVLGGGQLSGVRLKKSAAGLSGAIKVAFTRATATSKSERLVFDFDEKSFWLEEADSPMLVQTKDLAGTGGAAAVTDAEREALAAGEQAIKGPSISKPFFKAVSTMGIGGGEGASKGPIKLPTPIGFRSIQTAHDDAPHVQGRAYLYFWPGGLTERASIQLQIGKSVETNETLTLLLAPLTGKATVKQGPVDLVLPQDDTEASERQDTGSP